MGYISDVADKYSAARLEGGIGAGLGAGVRATAKSVGAIASNAANNAGALTRANPSLAPISTAINIAEGVPGFLRTVSGGSASPPVAVPAVPPAPPLAPPKGGQAYATNRSISGSIADAPQEKFQQGYQSGEETGVNLAQNIATPPQVRQAAQLNLVRNGDKQNRIDSLQRPIDGIDLPSFTPTTALGGLIGSTIALGGINRLNHLRRSELKSLTGEQSLTDKTAIDQFQANTQASNANTNAQNANTASLAEQSRADATKVGIEKTRGEIELGALNLQKQKEFQALNAEMSNPSTTPDRRRQIERTLISSHGKNVAPAQIHSTPIFDSLGAKVGENLHERQADGTWKNVTPKPSINDDPRAATIKADTKMSREEKVKLLQAMGY